MYIKIKKIIDIIVAYISIILFSPIFIIIIIFIKIESKGSFLFKQKRFGENKKFFYIYKFRTMYTETPKDVPTHLLEDPEKYITKMGSFLRKTSLDELPQLVNILKGEMSFIGPRPALWNQYDLINERDKYKVNSLVPGLTGWAQINGRDEIPIELKAKLDGYYAKKINLFLDFRIVSITLYKVLFNIDVKEGS